MSACPPRSRNSSTVRQLFATSLFAFAALAAAAGSDDAERWWDGVVESRLDSSSPFPALVEPMAEPTHLHAVGGKP